MSTTYDATFQNKVLTMALRDNTFMQRVDGLLEPRYFDYETHSFLIDFANRHFESYKQVPSSHVLIMALKDGKAAKTLKDDFVKDVADVLKAVYSPGADISNREWTVDQVSEFARQRAMEAALEASIDILEKKGDFSQIDDAIRKAQSVGAHEGTGAASLFDDVEARCKARTARLAGTVVRGITTGHKELNDLLYHKGWGRKELSILMGGAKSGKSTGLQHFAIKGAEAGHQVLYITLENSNEVTGDRMDAAVANIPMKDLDTSAATVITAYDAIKKAGGCVEMHEFAGGSMKPSDLRRLLQKYRANGIAFDLVVVDYADEMDADGKHQEERHKLRSIYQGLRAIAIEEDLAMLTATQTNRAGNKATTVTATDVAEDFSKVRLADVLITISATDDEKKSNQVRLYLAAIRNSESGITLSCMCDRSRQRFITRILKVA